MKKENIVVAFSGGRTSAFMCWWLKTYMSHLYNFIFVYANTGLEHENTLKFVHNVDMFLGLNLIWVEAKFANKSENNSYTLVDYKSATRGVRLFEQMVKQYGLMNGTFIHCTRELKNRPIRKLSVEKLGTNYRIALGIRHDEFHRVKNRSDAIYPLATIAKIKKEEVLDFWKKQPFDLELEEHYGNCLTCYKKSDKKLKMIADENPEYFDDFIMLENKYSNIKSIDEDTPRIIFRNFRTAYEVKNNINLPDNILDLDECAEECGSMISEYDSKPIRASLF